MFHCKSNSDLGLCLPRIRAVPAGVDDSSVRSRADVLQDEEAFLTGGIEVSVVGLADSQEVGGGVTRRQLDDVGYQSRGT